jgi:hypothetical protein
MWTRDAIPPTTPRVRSILRSRPVASDLRVSGFRGLWLARLDHSGLGRACMLPQGLLDPEEAYRLGLAAGDAFNRGVAAAFAAPQVPVVLRPAPPLAPERSRSRSPGPPIIRTRVPVDERRPPSPGALARWDRRLTAWERKPSSSRRQDAARIALFAIYPYPVRHSSGTPVCGIRSCLERPGLPGSQQGQCPQGACGRCCRQSKFSSLCLHAHATGHQ